MMKLNTKVAEHDALWSAVDDWTGLWEEVWAIQSMWPELRGPPAKDAAYELIKKLLNEEFIYLCFFQDIGNQERLVPLEQALELLEIPENWEPPGEPKEHVLFAATEKGEKRMHELERSLQGEPDLKREWIN